MHPDKKVGLALGILLIGITGAFFFRNDAPSPVQETLTLTDPASLDRIASQKPGAPYFPEPKVESADGEGSGLGSVPELAASDVIPELPRVGPTGYQGMLAEPISARAIESSSEQFADRMTPLPSPGRDLDSLENVLARNSEARLNDRTVSVESAGVKVAVDGGLDSSKEKENQLRRSATVSKSDFITHEVVAGDNLSLLAKKYLGSHAKYLTLYEANRDVLATPDDLSLGMKLKIPVKSSVGKAAANQSPSASSTSTETGNSNAASRQGKPAFVQPDRAAVIALGGARRPGRSLSQAPPPDLPRVEGLNPGGDPAVIASRPE